MIVTVTANPALDKTAELDVLRPGELNRLKNIVIDVGGKGINVSKMIAVLGESSIAAGFAGENSGEKIEGVLRSAGIRADFVRVNGTTRTNLKILDRGAHLTEFNEPGVTVTEADVARLVKKLSDYAGEGVIFVLSGSLPQGVDVEFYARLIRIVHDRGATAFLDADGEAFRAALEEHPDFIKPNRHELMEYFQADGEPGLDELAELGARIVRTSAGKAAISLGADGALFIDESGVLRAPGIPVNVRSSVGAGDSMMGVFAWAAHKKISWEDAAKLAMAASAGAVTTRGANPPDGKLIERLLGQVHMEVLRELTF